MNCAYYSAITALTTLPSETVALSLKNSRKINQGGREGIREPLYTEI